MRLLCLGCCLLSSTLVSAQEWARFRGPNGSGVNANAVLPDRWSDADYEWKIDLPGLGHSSPVVWDERIFITSCDEKKSRRFLTCVHAADGRTLWQRDFSGGPQRLHKDNGQASATPTVDRHRVYVCWGNATEYLVVALTHAGEESWRVDLGPYKAGHGFGGSAIVHEGVLLVPNEQNGVSSLVGLDGLTGKKLWHVARKSKSHYATPCILEQNGRSAQAIFASWEHGITSLDPRTGSIHWEVDVFYKEHLECAIASPIVAGDLVVATCGYLGVNYETVAVRPDAAQNAAPRTAFRITKTAPLVPTPLVKDELLFLLNDRGVLTCASVRDGTELWRHRVTGDVYSSPVCAGNRLLCLSRDGEAVVVAADRQFEILGKSTLGEGAHATPALAHGRAYLRTLSHLMALGRRK